MAAVGQAERGTEANPIALDTVTVTPTTVNAVAENEPGSPAAEGEPGVVTAGADAAPGPAPAPGAPGDEKPTTTLSGGFGNVIIPPAEGRTATRATTAGSN